MAVWRETDYPHIAADARARGAVVYFGDEASVRSDLPFRHHVVAGRQDPDHH